MSRAQATAFAPASVGNVAVGFDVLGHAVQAIGDRVQARHIDEPGVRIEAITGLVSELPLEPEKNTAGMAVASLVRARGLTYGIALRIDKGVPLGSGLGGSAASAVAAVVAANALLPEPLPPLALLEHAAAGEAVASGAVHFDNIAPSLLGGLVLTLGAGAPQVRHVPVPESVRCVLVHPHMVLSTREARRILQPTVKLGDMVAQSARIAGFLTACFTGDLALLRPSLEDVVIEPQRKVLIPGFDAVKAAAIDGGALGCSISGAGPTIFAWCEASRAEHIRDDMVAAFARHGLESDAWISEIGGPGARILEE